MGYATIRAAVAGWIAPPNVPGLTTVYPAQPKMVSGADYGVFPVDTYNLGQQAAGCFAYVHIDDTRETRIATGGATSGIKQVTYSVGVVFPFLAVRAANDGSYIGAWDAIADGLKARLRANRTLGQDGLVVWQAGEDADDLHIASDLPRQDNAGNVYIWSVLELSVIEEVST